MVQHFDGLTSPWQRARRRTGSSFVARKLPAFAAPKMANAPNAIDHRAPVGHLIVHGRSHPHQGQHIDPLRGGPSKPSAERTVLGTLEGRLPGNLVRGFHGRPGRGQDFCWCSGDGVHRRGMSGCIFTLITHNTLGPGTLIRCGEGGAPCPSTVSIEGGTLEVATRCSHFFH